MAENFVTGTTQEQDPLVTGQGTGGTGDPTTTTTTESPLNPSVAVTPGATNAPHQMNVVEYGGNIVGGPSDFFTTDNPDTTDLNESMFLSQRNDQMDPNAAGTNIDSQNQAYQAVGGDNADNQDIQAAQAGTVDQTGQGKYDPTAAMDQMQNNQTQAAQGTVSQESVIDPAISQANAVQGEAAQEDLNAVNPLATVRGQLEQLQSDWVDPVTGEPKIPLYAQSSARQVSKIAAFKGMTGTAATAALATAMQEASITMATADAQFFQTLTLKNLDNRQQTAINNANILANIELHNADNRLAAAIENSKQFLQMDLANLDNEQQANILDSQSRIQAILADANAENVAKQFGADTDKFYDQLNSSIEQFNAGLTQDADKFNSTMSDSREKFYANMQYNIDQSNAEWRRNVTLTEDAQSFEAAKTDVQNMVSVSNEQLNRLWDRSDALLDYLWKTSNNQKDRDLELVLQKMKTQAQVDAARTAAEAENAGAIGSLFGTVFGDAASGLVSKIFSWG